MQSYDIIGHVIVEVLRSTEEVGPGGADLPGVTDGTWTVRQYYLKLDTNLLLKIGFHREIEPLELVNEESIVSTLINVDDLYDGVVGTVIVNVLCAGGIFIQVSSNKFIWKELGPSTSELWVRDVKSDSLNGLIMQPYW